MPHVDQDAILQVLRTNLVGPILVTQALVPLIASPGGIVVNVSSQLGSLAVGVDIDYAYNASKAAVWLLSKNIALYCAKKGLDVRSNSIHPTFIDTPILDPLRGMFGKEEAEAKLGRQVPLGRIGKPEEIAQAAIYLLSDESRFVTGAELKVDGGISAM